MNASYLGYIKRYIFFIENLEIFYRDIFSGDNQIRFLRPSEEDGVRNCHKDKKSIL